MVTEKDIIEYIENLPEEFFREKWNLGIKEVGEKMMVTEFGSFEGYMKENKKARLFFSTRRVGYDLYFIKRYKDIYENVSKDDFEKYYGKPAYRDIKEALENQSKGPEAYIWL